VLFKYLGNLNTFWYLFTPYISIFDILAQNIQSSNVHRLFYLSQTFFKFLDEAFEMAANSHGTVAVALSMNITYIKPPSTGDVLYAEAREVSRSGRIGTYAINVKNEGDNLIAICQALAYRKRDKLPFLD